MAKINFQTSRSERASYGAFFFGQNIIYMLMLQFLNLFYTDVVGIGAAAVGILFLVARVWDAVNDPLLGSLVDRCHFKGGKFLPWIKIVNIALPVITFLLFISPDWGDAESLAYAYVTYILWGMLYTLCDVPIFALATAMSSKNDERVILLTWGRMGALIASLIIASITMPLIEVAGWTATIGVMCVVAMLLMTPIRFIAIERLRTNNNETTSLRECLAHLKQNRPMKVFYLAMFLSASSNTALVTSTYFAIYNLGNGDSTWVGPLLVAQLIPMLLLAPLLPFLIRRIGKKNIFVWGSVIGGFFGIIQFVVGYENIALVIVLQMLKSAGSFLFLLLLGMYSADFVEYGQYHTNKRLEGLIFSMQTFFTKLTQAIAAGVGGILLGWIGYIANAEQTSETLTGIFILYCLVPAIGAFIGAIVIALYYDLPEDRVQKFIDQNNTMRKEDAY